MGDPEKANVRSPAWRGQAFIYGLLALLFVGLAGMVLHSWLLSAVGFLPLGALMLWLRLRDNQRAALDPEYAAQRENDRAEIRSKVEARERRAAPARERQFWYSILGIPFVAILLIVLRHSGTFAPWEKQEAILISGILVVSAALSIILISGVRWLKRLRDGRAKNQ